MTHSGFLSALSPSFNEYSSGTMAETAARVLSEFPPDAAVGFETTPEDPEDREEEEEEEEEDGDSTFEFPVPGQGDGDDFSPAAADEIFDNGQIRPLFPLFNTDLVFADTDWRDGFNFGSEREHRDSKFPDSVSIRMPLRELMISERPTSVTDSPSCSSSEADDLDGVAPETYCVWNPGMEDLRKKSKSTGSSKRWRIRDLLYRSNSDGGDSFVLLSSKKHHSFRKKAPETAENTNGESDRKRSYSPYKQDPAGFFARMNGLSRTIQPF